MKYILHHCRNLECNAGWIDEDIYNSEAPQKWKYCEDCVRVGMIQADSKYDVIPKRNSKPPKVGNA